MITFRLGWMLSRSGSSARATVALPVIAFAVVSTLLLTVLGGTHAIFSWRGGTGGTYQVLAVIALALLIVPLVTLGGSAARLSARRRDERLSTLRLLGATTTTVTALTVLESTALALIGALIGVVGYLALMPAVGLIRFRGAPLGAATVWLGVLPIAGVVVGVGLLAAASAVAGLRAVVISPLGVRTRNFAPRIHWVRLLIGVAVIGAAVVTMSALQVAGGVMVIGILSAASFGATIAVLNAVGPLVVAALAKRSARGAKTAGRLLAARSILESPKAAWRQVSGVAMTSFMAVVVGVGVATIDALGATDGGDRQALQLFGDIRTGVVITLVISFLMVACSVGVNQATAILDRRDLYVSLDRLGMPPATMDAARRRAVMSPLRTTAVGGAVVGAVVVFPVTGYAILFAPLSILVIAGCLAAGVTLVWLGLVATKPVLTTVLTSESRAGRSKLRAGGQPVG